jgi:hypothetical protein
LRQGLFAQGTLGIDHVQALAVPLSAVHTDQPQPYVQLISGHQVLHQTVEMGARGERDGQTLVSIKGLAENANVLSGSVGTLRAGTVVKFTSPATPAAGGQ